MLRDRVATEKRHTRLVKGQASPDDQRKGFSGELPFLQFQFQTILSGDWQRGERDSVKTEPVSTT